MKRLILTLALILIPLMSFSQTKDSEGHILVNLWKTFYKAEKADKPQDQADALDAIKKEASTQHLAWDFYDAAQRYVSVRSSINWKDRDKLRQAMSEEIDKFGEPVAVFYHNHAAWSCSTEVKYVREHKDELLKTYNPEFHVRDGNVTRRIYYKALLKFISNDYEYAIWSVYGSCSNTSLIEDYYGDKYPEAALAEFSECEDNYSYKSYKNYGEFINKYGDKAVTLLARQERLDYEFSQLRGSNSAIASDFEALRARCVAFENDKAKYTGDEKLIASCCVRVKSMISQLDDKTIDCEVTDGVLNVVVRNLKSVNMTVARDGKVIHRATLENKANRYYLKDAITYKLPDFDDGEYTVICTNGDVTDETYYLKNTLSIAVRAISDGYGAFVADYETGRPLQTCDFTLYDADARKVASAEGVKLDGFTMLPQKFQSYFDKDDYRYFYLQASASDKSGRKLLSSKISTRAPHPGKVSAIKNTMYERAVILTDRGAYNPGEIMHFKVIRFRGTYEYELGPAGEKIKVELYDTESNLLGTRDLVTGEFGSADGSFSLSGGSRGGLYTIRVTAGDEDFSKSVRVDEFVLPTFDLKWDEDKMLYLKGDEVRVGGKVAAYSGHALGDVKARYKINDDPEREMQIAPDGRFSFTFPTKDTNYSYGYHITVTIVDNTGETLDFNTYRVVQGSLPLSINLLNSVEGRYSLTGKSAKMGSGYRWIVRDAYARFSFTTEGKEREGLLINWDISDENEKIVRSGKATHDTPLDIDVSDLPSGIYRIHSVARARFANGSDTSTERTATFVKASDDDTALNMDVTSFFKELGGEDIAIQVGTTDGPAWVVVELVGSGNILLEHAIVQLSGERGKAGSLKTISYSRKDSYPESLTLHVLFFHKGEAYSYTRTLKLPVKVRKLPLEFTRFTDLASPGQECSLLIKTDPGVECAATIFDKATETIYPNLWSRIEPARRPEPRVSYYNVCGVNSTHYERYYAEDYRAAGGRVLRKGAEPMETVNAAMLEDSVDAVAVDEEAAPVAEAARVREDFGATMAWEPALRSDKDGVMELKFTGADRLSTYYVQLFAHGEGMKNETLRTEMKVSIPVKVSLVQPLFLYEGDDYTARVSLSSSMEVPVSGRVSVRFYDGDSYKESPVLATKSARVTIPAGSSIPFEAPFVMPQGVEKLGVRVDFVADDSKFGSDAVFVAIPGMRAVQTLTEAHSSILLAGQDREALIAELRSMFVNADASSIEPVERDILGMIRDAIPDSVEPKGTNVISLTEAYYANIIARRVGAPGLDDEALKGIMDKIVACQNASGGIAWFEGMESSPAITAAVLQRIAAMPEADTAGIRVEDAVKYLDSTYFERNGMPWWCGGVSLPVYLQTRALFPDVPFDAPSGKAYRNFKKEAKAYLVPSSARGLNGRILDKARRLRILQLLADGGDGGKKLAKSWGIICFNRVRRSLDADVESLLQYAVEHRSGGFYYPNAVMPWRGLLESELYAHSLLCDLLTCVADRGTGYSGKPAPYSAKARTVAEGIRLWIMVQKETQQWEKDAAYIESIASVLRGTPETLQTKVILLSAEFTKPFPEVKAAGNGFTISRVFTRDGELISDGDPVSVGDRIVAHYSIWSEENRSFVRITSPRPASMRPVDQLSGRIGWWLRPMSYGIWSFSPQGYRNVLSDRTEYWFDTYPEENTSVSEEFFITQEGRFQTPAVWVESLYAPHYRANDDGRGPLESN